MILEWLSARSEFKLMTQKMYQEAEKWDEANHALRSRVKKFSKINGIISSYEINKYFFAYVEAKSYLCNSKLDFILFLI